MKKIKYRLFGEDHFIDPLIPTGISKRKKDVLSRYTIEDITPRKWWEFWKENRIRMVKLFCEGADVLDKGDFVSVLQSLQAGVSGIDVWDKEVYCPDCKMMVKPFWAGGAYPESYSVECPHCSFLFAED